MSKSASVYIHFRQRRLERLLIAAWIFGLLLGAVGRCVWKPFSGGLVPAGSQLSVTLPVLWGLVSLVLAWGLPQQWMLCFAGFLAASFSWTAMGIRLAFGSAGWLLWPGFLFGELVFFPFLFFLWLRLLSGRRLIPAVFFSMVTAAMISLADLCLVMPFMAFLIESK